MTYLLSLYIPATYSNTNSTTSPVHHYHYHKQPSHFKRHHHSAMPKTPSLRSEKSSSKGHSRKEHGSRSEHKSHSSSRRHGTSTSTSAPNIGEIPSYLEPVTASTVASSLATVSAELATVSAQLASALATNESLQSQLAQWVHGERVDSISTIIDHSWGPVIKVFGIYKSLFGANPPDAYEYDDKENDGLVEYLIPQAFIM